MCSLDKTLLAFALLHSVLQGQTCLFPQVSLDFLLLHSSPLGIKGYLFLVLVLEDLAGLQRTKQPQLLWHQGLPGSSDGKESAYNAGDLGSIPGPEDPLREGVATHSSILAGRIPMDRGSWQATVSGVTKSQTSLSDKQT